MFKEWLNKYEKIIYHLLHHYSIKYDFDEYYQLALIRLWQLQESYDPSKCKNRDQYVYLKLKFYIIDEMRKRIKYQNRFTPQSDDILIPLIDTHHNTYFDLYINGIDEHLNELEKLWFNDALAGYKLSEIAERMGRSPSTVKKIRRQAREKICKHENTHSNLVHNLV